MYGIVPDGLTHNCCFFRDEFLDRPCAEATKEAQRLLADALDQLKGLDGNLDQASMYATFLKLLRTIFDGAGRPPSDPSKTGWVCVSEERDAVTEALSRIAIHHDTTVGQSVEAVAYARRGFVYDAKGKTAAPCYQIRSVTRGASASGDSDWGGEGGIAECGDGGGAGAASGAGATQAADGGRGGEAGCHGAAAASTAGRPFHCHDDARIGPLEAASQSPDQFTFTKIKAKNDLRKQALIGALSSQTFINGENHNLLLHAYATEKNGSCWPLAVLREWGVVLSNDVITEKIRGVLGAKFQNFQRWAEYGQRLSLAEPKETKYLSVIDLRDHACRLLLDNLDKVSDLFLATPLDNEGDLEQGMRLAEQLGIVTEFQEDEPHRFVKAWAFVVLNPATHWTEQLWKAFFRLEFDGLMALLIITKLQKGKGKRSTTTYECSPYQPLIGDRPAQVAVAVINEIKLPVVEDAKIKELAKLLLVQVGSTRAKTAAITDSEVGRNSEDLERDIKTKMYAQANGKGHFQQATIVGKHGPDVLILAAASDVGINGMSHSTELHPGASGAGSAAHQVNPEPLSPITGSTPLGGESGCAKSGRSSGNSGKRRKKTDGEGGQAKIKSFFSPCKPHF